jgi:hypothetical protein
MKRLTRLREQRTDLATKHLTDQVKCETIEPRDEHETMFNFFSQSNECICFVGATGENKVTN